MKTKKCPRCGLVNSGTALNCDCGYNFETNTCDNRYKSNAGASFEPNARYQSYHQVPFFRKHWFVLLSFFLFTPMALIIALTGDIYSLRNNRVYKYSNERKRLIITLSSFILILGLVHIVTHSNPAFF